MTGRNRRCFLVAAVVLAFAQSGCARSQAANIPTTQPIADVFFAAAAQDVTRSIQKTFYDPKTGLYAHSTEDRNPEAMWGNGVMFSALVAAARHEPRVYRPLLARFYQSLEPYWDAQAKVPGYEPWPTQGGNDKYYDDNQWMVLTFLEAYELTREKKYLDRADQALRFSLSGWDDELGGGIWWHEKHKDGTKNTCSNAPAAVACLRMARFRRRDENIAWARRIVAWTNEHLRDSDGLFFDRQRVDSGKINKHKRTYNAALMLRANLELHQLTGERQFLDEATRIAVACDHFVDKETGAYRDPFKFTHLLVEADLEFHRATADKKVLARAIRNGEVAYARWQKKPPAELIENASIARMLWLLSQRKTPMPGNKPRK
jgi:uncharacterized protein YyaL (SSP411 family)